MNYYEEQARGNFNQIRTKHATEAVEEEGGSMDLLLCNTRGYFRRRKNNTNWGLYAVINFKSVPQIHSIVRGKHVSNIQVMKSRKFEAGDTGFIVERRSHPQEQARVGQQG